MNFCDKQRCLEFCIMVLYSCNNVCTILLVLQTGYSSLTQDAIRKDLNLSLAELCVCFRVCVVAFVVSESGAAGFIIWRNGL
ncbi:hypothetical protein P8452_27635 [Trifolium repens]|nr:hypothetical protein P8452_27635 [Trifolium repens]